MEQPAHEHVEHGNPVANPDAEWVGPSAETRFWLKCRAAQRKFPTAEFEGVVDHSLEQTEVDGKLRVGFSIKADVITDRRLAVAYGSYKPQQLIVASDDCAAQVIAKLRRQLWEKCRRQRH